MAYKLMLPGTPDGMPFLWNVSQHVGRLKKHPNLPTDVELVQFLIVENVNRGLLGFNGTSGSKAPPLSVDGRFSAILGFWIFYCECSASPTSPQQVDGVVSPAHGTSYRAGAQWAIARLNKWLRDADYGFWSSLDGDSRLSAGLRFELKRTAP
jgi:hypothetical protein